MKTIAALFALIAPALPLLAHSPEHPVGTTVVAAAPHSRGYESMASDGTDFFVVWSDYRAERRGSLIGTRVRRSGQVLDPLGIRLTTLGNDAQDPQVVWDGGAYLITWTSSYPDRDVYAARIDRDGRIVMAPRIIVPDAMAATGHYAASNGNLTVIAYHSLDYDAPARVVFLDREGNVLRHETITETSPRYMSGPSIAATASHFMLVWSAFDDQTRVSTIYAMALSSGGHLEKGATLIGTGFKPLVATDGSRFLVLWEQWVEPTSRLFARTIDASLTQATAAQMLARAERFPPSLLWRGNRYEIFVGRYTVAYGSQIYSIDVDADGNKIAERNLGPMTTGYEDAFPIAATNGGDLMVAFTKRFGPSWNGHQIFSRIYPTKSIAPTPDQLLAWSGNAHNNPDVTSSAAGHFVAWQESEGVYAARIDANGLSPDGRGIRLSDNSSRPHLAFNGTHYVVAWLEEWETIRVQWVSPATGKIVASAEIPVPWMEKIAMTASAEATYLAYVDDDDLRVKVIRIPHTTHIPDAVPAVVSPEDMYVDAPALAWNGSTLLVVWNENRIPSIEPDLPGAVRAHAARLTADLTLLDPAPLLIAATDAEMTFTFGTPSVASNGADWLVVTDSKEQAHILARRVLNNGTLEGSEPVKIADGSNPVAVFDGTRYTVSWKSGQPFWWPDASIVLAAVPSSGTIQATLRTLVSTHATADVPAIARTATGEIAVVYTKLSFAPEHMGVERSYMRVMDLGGSPRGRVVRR